MFQKLISILILFLGFSSLANAQKTKVTGNITGLKAETISFSYLSGDSSVTDSVVVVDGKFTWEANMPEPQKVYILFPTRYFPFFAEPGNIQITGNADSLHKLQVNGSSIQLEADNFEKSLADLRSQEDPLYQKWGKVSKEEQIALEKKIDDLRRQRKTRTNQYITAHPKSYFSLSLVSDRATMGQYKDVKAAFDLLDPSMQQSTPGEMIAKRLDVLKRSAIGETVLNFTQADTEGKQISFSQFKGKYVLIDFWASWCGPCRAENPNVLAAYNKYKDKNFTVLGVSLDEDGAKWKKAIADDGMPWTQVSDLKGWKNEVSTYYGIQGIPSTLLVDPDGKIIAKDLRGVVLNEKLAELFD